MININKRKVINTAIYLLAFVVITVTTLLAVNNLYDDLFREWGFMTWVVPGFFLLNAFIALPTAASGSIISRRAGWIAWLLTISALLAVGVYMFFTKWRLDLPLYMSGIMFYVFLFVVPQMASYYLLPDRPIFHPLVAGGLGLGSALLWIILGALTGSTPD